MDVPESEVHSFIVKLWIDEIDDLENAISHGYVTHVPGGERRYLRSLGDITDFIEQLLRKMRNEHASTV